MKQYGNMLKKLGADLSIKMPLYYQNKSCGVEKTVLQSFYLYDRICADIIFML